MNRRVHVPVVLAVVLLAALGACRSDPTPVPRPAEATKQGSGQERHDLAPLTRRFPRLGDPLGATWYSGTLGGDRAPGPSTYWIDAVVELEPATAAALQREHAPAAAQEPPDVVDELRPDLSASGLLASSSLSSAFSTPGFSARVWLDPSGHRLVLSARGQGD